MKWNTEEKKQARALYELAKQRDYEKLMANVKKRVPKKPEDVWQLQKYLNEQAKEFDRVYQFRYGYILETFVYLVRKGILKKEELQPLGEEKSCYINDLLRILTVSDDVPQIYQIKVLLEGTKPTVYRTIEIPENATFFDLHMVIQIAFNWYDAHLHEFRKENLLISDPEFYDDVMYEFEDEKLVNENKIQISEILQSPKDKIKYLYDFGDSWEHSVTLEKITDAIDGVEYPRCIRGKRCTPPEDVGGVWGFEEFKEAMADPHHEEHESYKEWYGGDFDSEFVDFEDINEQFQAYHEQRDEV